MPVRFAYFTQAELIYVGNTYAGDGTPQEVQIVRIAPVKETKTVSYNYYSQNQRLMRNSRQLIVPTWRSQDIVEDGITYELLYVRYQGVMFRVREIMRYYLTSPHLRVILDIEEIE